MAELMLRLDKYLAELGIGTRSEVKQLIRKGCISVDDMIMKHADVKINPDSQIVKYLGNPLHYVEKEYYMLNKPAGVVSATVDARDKTVLELIDTKIRKDLFPVGRLDKDTEGLLLITNDGEMAHRLLAPKKHVDKLYYAKIDGRVTEQDIEQFELGVQISESVVTKPARLKIIKSDEISEIELTIQEGKFHQVKRMFEAVDKRVIYLKRLSMGSLVLDNNLEVGQYRPLTKEEIQNLC
ncbi:pseudouridine synthase [Lachnospiraceae bacterium LCP25S3_G4]